MSINKKPREVYYDIQLTNYESANSYKQILSFSETRNSPIIKNTGDYSMSIVRFELDTYALPTFFPSINLDGSDVNNMIDAVTLRYKNNRVLRRLQWFPFDANAVVPTEMPKLTEPMPEYYYGQNFQHYCNIVNVALQSTADALKTSFPVDLANLIAPRIVWNASEQLAEFITQDEHFNNANGGDYIQIYFNRSLFAKFSSFHSTKYNNGNFEQIYEILINNHLGSNNVTLNNELFIKTKQEYSTIVNWSAISSIVFTSNTIPIIPTQIANPVIFNKGIKINDTSNSNIQSNIITDLATLDLCYKPTLMYSPGAEYRYIDMFGNNDLHTFDIQVHWKDRYGNLYPFYLGSGGSASIKVLFKLKD